MNATYFIVLFGAILYGVKNCYREGGSHMADVMMALAMLAGAVIVLILVYKHQKRIEKNQK